MLTTKLECGDCLELMRQMPDNSVDLIFCSPPYENLRSYSELGFSLRGQAWVDWCVERWIECDRICKGLVCWVVEGRTSKFQWSATPALLMADLHRSGIKLRKPSVFGRRGIPGSGGPDYWRNDHETVVTSSKGRLPWSDNTANGSVPRYAPGGAMSHRLRDGSRIGGGVVTGYKNGDLAKNREYKPPKKANAGNVLKVSVGGGHMGHPLAHLNEAPFPVSLVAPFVKCFCPPDGIVFDPFMGSGTTGQAALKNGRSFHGIDIRKSQIDLTKRRLSGIAGNGPIQELRQLEIPFMEHEDG